MISFLKRVFRPDPPIQQIVSEAHALCDEKRHSQVNQALPPDDRRLLSEHADATAARGKKSAVYLARLERLLHVQGTDPSRISTVLKLSRFFIGLRQYHEAESRVRDALSVHPKSSRLLRHYAEIALLRHDWSSAALRWHAVATNLPQDAFASPDMMHALCGHWAALFLGGGSRAFTPSIIRHYEEHPKAWALHFKNGHARFIIFDNGRTRVEFIPKLFDPTSARLSTPTKLVISFDVMNMTWDKDPFGYVAFRQHDVDILAIRKHGKRDFHQDLTQREFLDIAHPLSARYAITSAIGHSLGGYSALYFASHIPGCRVLATSPRNPCNPKYGVPKYTNIKTYRHEYDMPPNPASRATIVYDPYDKIDGRYVRDSLMRSFPNAQYFTYPYCGHSITRYLRDTGLLKSSVLTFCDGGAFPPFDRKIRSSSSEYLRVLATLNFIAGRPNWARALAEKALSLGFDPERSTALLKQIRRGDVPAAKRTAFSE